MSHSPAPSEATLAPLEVTRLLTVKQPWADLIVQGIKTVENRTWEPPATLPQWFRCAACQAREIRPRGGSALHDCAPEGTWWRDGVFPFRIAIHAAASFAPVATQEFADGTSLEDASYEALDVIAASRKRLGVLVGFVTVTSSHPSWECVEPDRIPFYPEDPSWRLEATCSPEWAHTDHEVHHWMLADPEPIAEPIPLKGKLGLWHMPEGLCA